MDHPDVFEQQALKLEVRRGAGDINLRFIGKSTDRNPAAFIMPVLLDLLEESSKENKAIILDFRELDYMNSSTVTPIVKLLERAKRGKNRLTVVYQKALKWQELSFCALEIFQTADRRIQIKGLE